MLNRKKGLKYEAAAKGKEILDTLPDFGKDFIPSSKADYTADDKAVGGEMYDIVEIIVSDENVVIEVSGDSAHIDASGKLKDGRANYCPANT